MSVQINWIMTMRSNYLRIGIFLSFLISSTVRGQVPMTKEDSAEYRRIEIKHKSNYDFYKRVLSFSQLSWVAPTFLDRGSEKGYYVLSADISPHFNIGGERTRFVFQLTP